MKALFNNRIIGDEIILQLNDRALQFGDGLFETIAVRNKKPRYLNYHMERLLKGARILNLQLPKIITDDAEKCIAQILIENNLSTASIKLIVWRGTSTAKGYGFTATTANYMIICRPIKEPPGIINTADFAKDIYFQHSPLSGIKTLNALPYILASNEKQQRNLDEVIVLNNKGFVCECCSSNIFWVKDDKYFTPPLLSGCLDGVMRRVLIEKLESSGLQVAEQLIKPKELLKAGSIFTSNSSGIRFISQIGAHQFDTSIAKNPLLKDI